MNVDSPVLFPIPSCVPYLFYYAAPVGREERNATSALSTYLRPDKPAHSQLWHSLSVSRLSVLFIRIHPCPSVVLTSPPSQPDPVPSVPQSAFVTLPTPHSAFRIRFIPHSAPYIPHSAFRIPKSALRIRFIPHSEIHIPHSVHSVFPPDFTGVCANPQK